MRILDRNTPVADLVPVEPAGDGDEDDLLLADLERRGLARRGASGPLPAEILKPGPRIKSGVSIAETLVQERKRSR